MTVAVDPLRPATWGDRPWNLSEIDHECQRMCGELHMNGVWVDQAERQRIQAIFTTRYKAREKRLVEIMNAAGMSAGAIKGIVKDEEPDEDDKESDGKPGSYDQIRDLFYGKWDLGMPPGMEERDFYTSSGLPGTGDKVLRGHLSNDWLTPIQREMIEQLRLYRREKNKIVGTMLAAASLRTESPKGLAWEEDGRLHPTWNAHVVANARLSCSKPNLQTIGSRKGMGVIKRMYAAPPGRYFVGADLAQAHLYIAANYWQIKSLLDAFEHGWDPHVMLAEEVVRQAGGDYSKMPGWEAGYDIAKKPAKGSQALAVRELCKGKRYTGMYGAGVSLKGNGRYKFDPTTLLTLVRSTEQVDDDGNSTLPYLKFKSSEIIAFHQAWMSKEPDWIQSWEWEMAKFERQGYVADPIFFRRSGGLGNGKFNEVVNYPILTAEAHVMRLAEWNVRQAFPFAFAGHGTGMILQVHDSIIVELPLPKGFDPMWSPTKEMKAGKEPLPPEIERSRKLLEECMAISIPNWPLTMVSEAEVGRTLAHV